ncbi:MAG: ComF family protein [Clostridia bacterium]|nr:ComF family protein [Clostridia bacterium]
MFNLKWTCNCCGSELFTNGYFCDICEKEFTYVLDSKCDHCGRITKTPTLFCDSCTGRNVEFDTARSVFEYTEPISKVVKAFKYDGKKYLAEVFASKMLNVFLSSFSSANLLTYVPMTETKLKQRGYNQSKLLAEELSRLTGIEVKELAVKKADTHSQATLSAKERKDNLKSSFKFNKKLAKDKNVVIVDDVLTTGSTADVLAKGLKDAGALSVSVLTICSVSFLGEKKK